LRSAAPVPLDSRLRSPLPSDEEPCPLSLPYGFFTPQPEPLFIKEFSIRNERKLRILLEVNKENQEDGKDEERKM
jgi:hypothetical protein